MRKAKGSLAGIVMYALAGLIVIGALVLRTSARDNARARMATREGIIDGWRQLATEGQWIGPPNARVVVIAFSDYECPYCKKAQGILGALQMAFPEDLAIVYRHYPLESIHPRAYFAARVAECAADQGAFDAAHRFLFEVGVPAAADILDILTATNIGDTNRFVDCATSTGPVDAIERDREAAEALGITRTPSFILQGRLLRTNPDSVGWFQLIRAHLDDV